MRSCMNAAPAKTGPGTKIRKKTAKNPQKKRKKTANGHFFKKCTFENQDDP